MTNELPELKPCPFCKCEDVERIDRHQVCMRCGAKGPRITLFSDSKEWTWNTRTAPKVNPLVWEGEHCFHCSEVFDCETDFGRYTAYAPHVKSGFFWTVEDGVIQPEGGPFGSMESAKAAAQADYERRILSALA